MDFDRYADEDEDVTMMLSEEEDDAWMARLEDDEWLDAEIDRLADDETETEVHRHSSSSDVVDAAIAFDDDVELFVAGQLEGHVRLQARMIRAIRHKLRDEKARRMRARVLSAARVATAGTATLFAGVLLFPALGAANAGFVAVRVYMFVDTSLQKGVKVGARQTLVPLAGTVVSQGLSGGLGFVGVLSGYVLVPAAQGMAGALLDVALKLDPESTTASAATSSSIQDAVERELAEIRAVRDASGGKLTFEQAVEQVRADRASVLPKHVQRRLATTVAAVAFGNAAMAQVLPWTGVRDTVKPFLTSLLFKYTEASACIDKLVEYGMVKVGIDRDATLGDVLKAPDAWKRHWLGQYLYGQTIRQALSAAVSVQATQTFAAMMNGLEPANAYKFVKALESSAAATLESDRPIESWTDWMTHTSAPLSSEISVVEEVVVSDPIEIVTENDVPTTTAMTIDETLVKRLEETQAALMGERASLRRLRDDVDHRLALRAGVMMSSTGLEEMTKDIDASLRKLDDAVFATTDAKQQALLGQPTSLSDGLEPGAETKRVMDTVRARMADANAAIRREYADAAPFLERVLDARESNALASSVAATLSSRDKADLQKLLDQLRQKEQSHVDTSLDDASLKALADVRSALRRLETDATKTGDVRTDPSCVLQPFRPDCVSARSELRLERLTQRRAEADTFVGQVESVRPLLDAKADLVDGSEERRELDAIARDASGLVKDLDREIAAEKTVLDKAKAGVVDRVDRESREGNQATNELRKRLDALDVSLNDRVTKAYATSATFMEAVSLSSDAMLLSSEHARSLSKDALREAAERLASGSAATLEHKHVAAIRSLREAVEDTLGSGADAACVFDPSRPECTVDAALGGLVDGTATAAAGVAGAAVAWATGFGGLASSYVGAWTSYGFRKTVWDYDRSYNKGETYQRLLSTASTVLSSSEGRRIIDAIRRGSLLNEPKEALSGIATAAKAAKDVAALLDMARKAGALDGLFGRGIRSLR